MSSGDPYSLQTLHPQMWANIQFLRRLADELEFSSRFNWNGGKVAIRTISGRKYRKATGEIKVSFWLTDNDIKGVSEEALPDWPEWWQ
jgi:hypothetical protein